MADGTSIEWTDATWNCLRGCSLVSQGCRSCYAMRQAHRFSGKGGPYEGLTKMTSHGPTWTGKVRTVPELLDQPLRWKKPRRIFVNSMSDLFHEDVPFRFIAQVFAVMCRAEHHTFQVLTKRPIRMQAFMRAWNDGAMDTLALMGAQYAPKNIWLGVSVEDQATADERIALLLETPAAVRWISAEPLLGPVNLDEWLDDARLAADWREVSYRDAPARGLDWVVVGGESGPGARPMHPDWARALRDQCIAAGLPFLFKQWGEWTPNRPEPLLVVPAQICGVAPDDESLDFAPMLRLGKRAAGRTLDGVTWDQFPA